VKMICPKSETCKDRHAWCGMHCKPHNKTLDCSYSTNSDCPACVEVKPKKENEG
jgi:hypothetical protein